MKTWWKSIIKSEICAVNNNKKTEIIGLFVISEDLLSPIIISISGNFNNNFKLLHWYFPWYAPLPPPILTCSFSCLMSSLTVFSSRLLLSLVFFCTTFFLFYHTFSEHAQTIISFASRWTKQDLDLWSPHNKILHSFIDSTFHLYISALQTFSIFFSQNLFTNN